MENNKEILDRSTKKFLIEDMQEQQERMIDEREKNLTLLHQDFRDSLPKDLNSKLDRIQKFINQLKNIQDSKRDVLVNEALLLNLKRHTSEVVGSITQSKLSIKDQDTIIEICVLIHQRYEEFAVKLIEALEKLYEQEKMSEFNKKRNILRLLSELYLKGIFSEFKRIFKCLNYLVMISPDNIEEYQNAMMVVTDYLKTYGEIFFQVLSKQRREAIESDYEVTCDRYQFLTQNQLTRIQQYFKDYQAKCLSELNNKFKQLKEAQRLYEDTLKEVKQDEKVEQKYNMIRNEFERFHSIVQELADVIDVQMPKFVIDEDKSLQTKMIIKKRHAADVNDEVFPFDDELQCKFYKDLPDLSRFANEQSFSIPSSSDGDYDDIGKKMLKSQSKDQIDERSLEFMKNLSSIKGGKKRIAKILFEVPRNQMTLIPYYARFAATLNQYFKDIGNELVSMLEQEFNKLYEDSDVIKIETKIRNIRFLSELTKFNVCPPQIILECLKKCLDDFHAHNVEIIINLLETCGKYLHRVEETSLKFANLIEILERFKEKENLSSKSLSSLETLIQQCKGSTVKLQVKKTEALSTMQQYIRHLIVERLNKPSLDLVASLIDRLPWHEEEEFIQRTILQQISQYAKFNDMDTLAILLANLKIHQRPFVIRIMDQIVEEIIRGCEKNDFKEAQRRVAIMKFIAECYNFRVIHTSTLFDFLYKLINYDYEYRLEDEYMKTLDSAQDSFRIRLVCTVLDSLGRYFQKGERKKQMDRFLMFFQKYIFSKNYVLMDLEFMILDTFDTLRPKIIKFLSLDEAEEVCSQIEERENKGKEINDIIHEYHVRDPLDEYYDEEVHADDYYYEQEEENEKSDNKVKEDEDGEGDKDVDEEQVKAQVKQERQKILNEYERIEMMSFEQEFNSLIQESTQQARKDVGNILSQQRKEILIPYSQIKNKIENQKSSNTNSSPQKLQETPQSNKPQSMAFSLITKKGNKTNVKQIDVPINSYIVVKSKERKIAEDEEREKVKEQILKMTQEQNENIRDTEDGENSHNDSMDREN